MVKLTRIQLVPVVGSNSGKTMQKVRPGVNVLERYKVDSIAVSLSTNSIRRQDPNIYSDTETRALSSTKSLT